MSNLAFTKLGLKKNQEIKTVEYNEQIIEVKQYLPINDKLELIGKVLTDSQDENNFANPIKLEIFTNLYIIKYYTNITFTEKQWEDIPKLYDLIVSNNLNEIIINMIPENEYQKILNDIKATADAVYAYKNSVMGILESVNTDYSNLVYDAENLQQNIANPENLTLLKGILTNLG